MKKNFENLITLIKKQELNACLTGSCMLGYKEGWNQDCDVFCYDEQSFTALLYFCHYNPLFTILQPLEKDKFISYTQSNKSSLDSIGLISIKFTYNLCIPLNIVYRKGNKNIFDVISGFDNDLIAQGYCLRTKKFLSLRECKGRKLSWNKWCKSFYNSNQFDVKRLLRQFDRLCKYQSRGYNCTELLDKYISLTEEILSKENIYTSERGVAFYEKTNQEFTLVLKLLKAYKKEKKISPEGLQILKTLI
jgi:hypothetical protein